MKDVSARVMEILKSYNFSEKNIHLETPLKNFIIDSLDGVDLLIDLEVEFGIEIEDGVEDEWKINRVSDLVKFINERTRLK